MTGDGSGRDQGAGVLVFTAGRGGKGQGLGAWGV
jgi:hypothetical protein